MTVIERFLELVSFDTTSSEESGQHPSTPNQKVLGAELVRQMQDNISYMQDFKPLNDTELTAIAKVQEIFHSMHLIPCTACRYCTDGCPQQIPIPDYFATLNAKKVTPGWNAASYYNVHALHGGKASDCVKCGACEEVCPQHLPIRELLEQVAAEFEKPKES